MSDTPTAPVTTDPTRQGDQTVNARMSWRVANGAPELDLSFCGLHKPETLFDELRSLGWVVPPAPSRPRSAIQWIPDPVAGTEYTILPWRVDDLRLQHGQWTADDIASIGALTYDALYRHGAEISGTEKMLQTMRTRSVASVPTSASTRTAASPTTPSAEPVPTAPSVSATSDPTVPTAVLIDYRGEPVPGLEHLEGLTGGRSKIAVMWTQSSAPIGTLCSTHDDLVALFSNASHAWSVAYTTEPGSAGAGQRTLCAAIPAIDTNDKKLGKFIKALGSSFETAHLQPLDQRANDEAGVLIRGVIAANEYDLLSANLRMRFPKAVVRLDS